MKQTSQLQISFSTYEFRFVCSTIVRPPLQIPIPIQLLIIKMQKKEISDFSTCTLAEISCLCVCVYSTTLAVDTNL